MSENLSYTLFFPEALLGELKAHYQGLSASCPSPYIESYFKGEGFVISVYSKRKNGLIRVLFQGKGAKREVSIWIRKGAKPEADNKPVTTSISPKNPAKPMLNDGAFVSLFPQIGSDEVGTGDYFGPIIVVASYVEEKDLPYLESLGVTDSKKMNDSRILEIGPELISKFPYSQLCLDNPKYNEIHSHGININVMKAKMHNRALSNLAKKFPSAYRYIDQFAPEGLYYSYLKEEREELRGINFATKGELHYPSVALASVIARYSFLLHMKELSEKVGATLPFGASNEVVKFAKRFLKTHSEEELDSISKADFATRKKVLGN